MSTPYDDAKMMLEMGQSIYERDGASELASLSALALDCVALVEAIEREQVRPPQNGGDLWMAMDNQGIRHFAPKPLDAYRKAREAKR